jgi:hypothetical protein
MTSFGFADFGFAYSHSNLVPWHISLMPRQNKLFVVLPGVSDLFDQRSGCHSFSRQDKIREAADNGKTMVNISQKPEAQIV